MLPIVGHAPYALLPQLKRCTDCRNLKSLEGFPKSRAERDGRHYYCRKCHNARTYRSKRAAFAADPIRIIARERHYKVRTRDQNGQVPPGSTLTRAQIETLLRATKVCAIDHMPLDFGNPADPKTNRDRVPSLDRIDSSKPYTLDNVQIVAAKNNRAKSNLTEAELNRNAIHRIEKLPRFAILQNYYLH